MMQELMMIVISIYGTYKILTIHAFWTFETKLQTAITAIFLFLVIMMFLTWISHVIEKIEAHLNKCRSRSLSAASVVNIGAVSDKDTVRTNSKDD